MSKSRKKKPGFHRGFKRTAVLGDKGYVKPRKDGGRYHKYGKSGRVHVDKHDPAIRPGRHIAEDYLGIRRKKKRR